MVSEQAPSPFVQVAGQVLPRSVEFAGVFEVSLDLSLYILYHRETFPSFIPEGDFADLL